MLGVGLDCQHERVGLVALEEADGDPVLPAQFSRSHTMETIDDAHRRTVHEDGRKRRLHRGERLHVVRVLPEVRGESTVDSKLISTSTTAC